MILRIDANTPSIGIGKCPTNIIMTTKIVNPYGISGQSTACLGAGNQQFGLTCGQGLPHQGHQVGVIGNRTFIGTNVFNHLIRGHNGFRLQYHTWSGKAQKGIKGLNQAMSVGQVLAIGLGLFPGKRKGIQSNNIGTSIDQFEHFTAHRGIDFGVLII